MEEFINKWFPPQNPNLASRYGSDYVPKIKSSMDKLKEIDRKLMLLHEYLRYRISYNAEYGAIATYQRFENTGVYLIGPRMESFEEWCEHENNKDFYLKLI